MAHACIKKDVSLIKNKKYFNRNAITTGSRVMVSGTGHTGKILSIDTEGLTAEQIRRGKTVVVEGCEEKLAPLDLIRLGMN